MENYFSSIDLYGGTVQIDTKTEDCDVFHLENSTGTGDITKYRVFPGFELIYNDIHMEQFDQANAKRVNNVIEINHCREGRYECTFGHQTCCYMAPGDLSISSLTQNKSVSSFPIRHYHGISIFIALDDIAPEVTLIMKMLSINFEHIKSLIGNEKQHCIIRANESIEHIFYELYTNRDFRKEGYIKLKVFELLLFLSGLEVLKQSAETKYWNQKHVKKIKEIHNFITQDISRRYTIAELAQKFEISQTSLKACFKGVYGTSIYAYLRAYRLQTGRKLLEVSDLTITDISIQIGYENPNKFTSAFKEVYGASPMEYRKTCLFG
ncbi:MAG: helix-turn-helix transcriptional regulator [Lachnospiraceae bacterium]